jgi:hypothetical protein
MHTALCFSSLIARLLADGTLAARERGLSARPAVSTQTISSYRLLRVRATVAINYDKENADHPWDMSAETHVTSKSVF